MRRLILIAALPLAACGIGGRDDANQTAAAGGDGRTQRDYPLTDFTNVVLAGPDATPFEPPRDRR